MISFDWSLRSMLIKDIIEDEGAIWNEGVISLISINIYSY